MNCSEIQNLLSGYLYDALSPEEQKEVSSHLEQCLHCSEELENLKKKFSMLECWEDREPPPALASATISALAEKKASFFSLWLPRFRFAFLFIVVAYTVVMGGMYSLHKFLPMDDQQTLFNAPTELFPEAPASFRIVVQTLKGEHPVKGAKVKVELQNNKTKQKTGLFTGTTDAEGTVEPRIKVPSLPEGSYTIIVNTRSIRGKNTIQSPVSLERYCRILLSTDRPVYQPGQTIHIRSLALLEGLRKAPESGSSIFEVEDPKGNKVFKKSLPVGAFGISSCDFILAREINTGNYRIRATIGKDTAERVVEVKRYVLPKFKIAFEPSRKVYRPGETITGKVKGRYFFGKSVQKGRISIDLSSFDVAFHKVSHLEGKTDSEGVFKLSIPLPSYFVGQPLEKGKGLLKCDISLKDSAGHEEKITETLHVDETAEDSTQAGIRGKNLPINIDCIPEKKSFIPGMAQKVFVVTTLPGGASPLSCDVTVITSEGILRSTTDRFGIAEFTVNPQSHYFEMKIEARKGNDYCGILKDKLNASMDPDAVLLRTDRALYNVGNTMKVTVLSQELAGTVYLDVLRNDQIILTKALELTNGQSDMTLDLTDDCTGTLTINAYRTTNYTAASGSGITVRDTRMVTVFPSRDLTVSARSDKKTYRPGDKAHICYEVKDDTGIPVPAAIGVNIVDESVFALADRHPGLEKIYFAIEREIMEPEIELCSRNRSINISEIKEAPGDDISTQRAAEVLFTALLQDRPINFISSLKETQDRYWMAKEGYLKIVRIMIWIPAILVIAWLCVIFRTSLITVLKYCSYLVIAALAVGALFSASRYLLTIKERQYNDCFSNLKNMGTAMEMYSSDNQGRYPHSLSQLTPGYLQSLPTCPSAGKITYSYTWTVIPDCYTVWCNGGYHTPNYRPNFPEYDAVQGIYEKVDDGGTGAHESNGPAINDTIQFYPSSNQGGTGTRETQSSNATQVQTPEHRKVQGSLSSAPDIRVRQFFPETLYWNPLVITDEKGKAEIEVPIADSITTWRMAATASTREGVIGSTTAPLAVFQDFFIEPDLPEHLTRGDEITLPVAVYNYLPHPQKITVTLKSSDWFDTTGLTARNVTLGASDVRSVPFTIRAKKLGDFRFNVEGSSNEHSDAVSKPIRVDPEGKETVVTQNGNMEKRAVCSITIPPDSVPGGSTVLVKIYPALTTQIVDGLEGMLSMPHGCFEQNTSATYPNVMILRYLKGKNMIQPELQMKAEGLINTGYQSLIAFEVPGGGFSWFGRSPASRTLTAYGLLEFNDMKQVYPIDEKIIERTQRWLASQQNSDGSFSFYSTHEYCSTPDENRTLPATAYITWALMESGCQSQAAERGLMYLKRHLAGCNDPYVLALSANCLVLSDRSSHETAELCRKLASMAVVNEDKVYWKCHQTAMNGYGEAAEIETTALAAQALLRFGSDTGLAQKALNYLTATKGPGGSWGSTQATVLALRTLTEAEKKPGRQSGKIAVSINGKVHTTFTVTPETSDVLQMADLRDEIKTGNNKIELQYNGTGTFTYQVAGKYFLPWKKEQEAGEKPLSINVSYDRTTLSSDDTVKVTAIVGRKGASSAGMVIADLGVPPGFTVITEDLDRMKDTGLIQRYELTSRQIILYLMEVRSGQKLSLPYRLKARFPIRAKSPASAVYDYYNPGVRAESPPEQITVK